MKEYYVDVENVGIKWIDIYKEMSKNDKNQVKKCDFNV